MGFVGSSPARKLPHWRWHCPMRRTSQSVPFRHISKVSVTVDRNSSKFCLIVLLEESNKMRICKFKIRTQVKCTINYLFLMFSNFCSWIWNEMLIVVIKQHLTLEMKSHARKKNLFGALTWNSISRHPRRRGVTTINVLIKIIQPLEIYLHFHFLKWWLK